MNTAINAFQINTRNMHYFRFLGSNGQIDSMKSFLEKFINILYSPVYLIIDS